MSTPDISAIRSTVSPARLESYRNGGNDLQMLANYFRNIALSEALYPALQAFEITYRNSLHQALQKRFDQEDWFNTVAFRELPSNERHIAALVDVQRGLVRDRKPTPVSTDHIVSRLNFGFWHGLLNRPFEATLWRPDSWRLISETFPHAPRRFRDRQKLWIRVDHIRVLRNRVMHYEPIWSRPDLKGDYLSIVQAIDWINPTMGEAVGAIDRFMAVLMENDETSIARTKTQRG